MPLKNFRIGLSLKFILLTTLLIVLTSMTLGYFFLRSKEEDYIEFLKSRGSALSRILAFNSEYGILTNNTEALAKLAQGVVQESDVSYCVIHDPKGKILIELYKDALIKNQIPQSLIDLAVRQVLPEDKSFIQSIPPEKEVPIGFDIATISKTRRFAKTREKGELLPGYLGILEQIKKRFYIEGQIVEEKIGTVRVGLSLTSLLQSLSMMKRTIVMITIIVILVGILITIFLVQLIISPIRRLVYGTRQIARGDLNYEVKVHSRDEIGEFAKSFNQMTLFLRKSRDQIEEYSKNLEQMVEERTRRLQETEAELIRSEKFAAIGELITGITHELNNKLTPILGYAQIFRAMAIDEKIMKYIDIIEESAVNAKRIVESLLKFSRTAPPQKTQTDLNHTMKETLTLIDPHIRKNNIQLELNLDSHLPITMADPGLISQVFLNILNNAWQAMEEKGGTLTVRSHTENGKIFFSIKDTGMGISKENLNRIFDPFFTTKEVGKGTGLGLSICYGILQNHQGTIHVDSHPGRGSTFIIELPVKSPDHSPISVYKEKLAKTSFQNARILIIEDEDSIRNLLKDILKSHHAVSLASNGKEAQTMIEKDRFDIYIVDLRMPVMDGKDLFNWIQKAHPSETEKVIFITGDTYDKKTQVFLSQIQRPQISKPFQIQILENVIAQVLEKTFQKNASA